MKADLSIVIISWNTRQLLQECLESVFSETTGLRLEVFVGDNGSNDGSVEMVRGQFPQVHLVENRANLGFAKANNQLFPLCSADLLMLLNSDTVVRDDALRALCNFMRANPDVGAVGPKLVHPRARLRVLGCGQKTTLRTTFTHYFFLSALFPHIRALEGIHYYVGAHDDKVRDVGWISGACLVVRQSVLEQVGPLSERWFMYAEDQEWCARMSSAGWRLCQEPAAVVEHHLGASTSKNASVSLLPVTAGRDLFVELNRPSNVELWLFDVIRSIGLGMRAVAYAVCRFTDPERRVLWQERAKEFGAYTRAASPFAQRTKGAGTAVD